MTELFKLLNVKKWLIKEDRPSINNEKTNAVEVHATANTAEDENLIYVAILQRLNDDKVYLDASLSLSKLSTEIGTNTTYLSNTINRCFHCNFKTLINNYRIDYCKKLLSTHGSTLSVNKLYKESGFTSISAFYAVFKKTTGQSPAQYRNNIYEKTNN